MKGLELSRLFFEEHGLPMLREKFPEALPYLAAGLVGRGSEMLGYDDALSADHDFEPGFCLFLPAEAVIDRRTAFELERAYSYLPREYKGFKRANLSSQDDLRHGIIRAADFYSNLTGSPDGNLSAAQWLSLSDYNLLEATNGEIYFDNLGEFTRIRTALSYYPSDIRLKKLAGELYLMGQSGSYNFNRTIAHGETAAAQLGLSRYAEACLHVIFLINRAYMPYYKWAFRALRALPILGDLGDSLEYLLTTPNTPDDVSLKNEVITMIDNLIKECLAEERLIMDPERDLGACALAVNDAIADEKIRNMNLLAGV